MKKYIVLICLILITGLFKVSSQSKPDTSVFLITCGPGLETYSHYGHSALRIVIPSEEFDLVYNWGVFDFSTPNFAYKFAKGKLEYLLDTESFRSFLRPYHYEQRWVQIQKINLESDEIRNLMELIAVNLRPENRKYRYDFFYDDCSTRIRDLLEKVIGLNLNYAPTDDQEKLSFRFLTGSYQRSYPWLDLGIDLLMGTPSDKIPTYRDKMFLPIEMQKSLSEALVNRNGRMVPLLQNPATILDFPVPEIKNRFIFSPAFIFTILLILLIIFFAKVKNSFAIRVADILIFTIYSVLALLMIFTNLITDHQQMKMNLALLWLTPFIPICLAALILNKEWFIWFRIVFVLSIIPLFIIILAPHLGNISFIPLIVIISFRSSARAGFSWNPFSVIPI